MLCLRVYYWMVWPVSDHPKFATGALFAYTQRLLMSSLQGMHAAPAQAAFLAVAVLEYIAGHLFRV